MKVSIGLILLTILVIVLMGAVVIGAKIGGWPAAVIVLSPLLFLFIFVHPDILDDAKQVAISMFGKRPIVQSDFNAHVFQEVEQPKSVEEVKPPVSAPTPNPPLENTSPVATVSEPAPSDNSGTKIPPASEKTKTEGAV
jgi:hypothetical protein